MNVYNEKPEQLENDVRFVECLMWFGRFKPRLYGDIVKNGIGRKCAVTYVMFAKQLAKKGHLFDAMAVISFGLEDDALPISYLQVKRWSNSVESYETI